MSTLDFLSLLITHYYSFLISLAISVALFFIVLKKSSISWLNPIRYNILIHLIATSVLIFLYLNDSISFILFSYTIICTILFWSIFLILKPSNFFKLTDKFKDEKKYIHFLFIVAYLIIIIFTLLTYIMVGIPAFNPNGRLATFTGTGFGFIERLSGCLTIYCIMYIYDLINSSRSVGRVFFGIFLILPLIIIGLLSGSRSFFLLFIFTYWGYRTFYKHKEPMLSKYKWFILAFIVITILAFIMDTKSNFNYALYSVFIRTISNGDIYWMSLPHNIWKQIVITNPYLYSIAGFIGPLHIFNMNSISPPIGFQLTWSIYPILSGVSTGPVALYPVFGLVCFGLVGGLFFSIIQSLLFSFIYRHSLVKSNSLIVSSICFYFYFNNLSLLGDISQGLGQLFDSIVSTVFLLLILNIIIYLVNHINPSRIEQ